MSLSTAFYKVKQMNKERQNLKHKVNMEIASSVSRLSTCQFTQVGSVIVEPTSNRILSTGYNGSLPGQTHCDDIYFADRDEHKEWSDENEQHAEQNSVLNAAKNGQATEGAYLYCTLAPCFQCAKVLAGAGIRKVFFKDFYWRQGEKLYLNDIISYERISN